MSAELTVSIEDLPPLTALEAEWTALETDGDHSFFTSWSWLGTWLACLPEGRRPRILRARRDGRVVGMALLGSHRVVRRRVITSRRLHLNETGDPALDEITIEHNGVLSARTDAEAIREAMLAFLLERVEGWDELVLENVEVGGTTVTSHAFQGFVRRVRRPCHVVPLGDVRRSANGYLGLLSSNTRQQIRRSIRRFEEIGEVRCRHPGSVDDALAYLAELRALHQSYWTAKGLPGSFANTFFSTFHDRLVRSRWSSGEIQILRIEAGDTAIGYLYNLVQGGRVCNYQSGFDYAVTEGGKPGLVAHALAIDESARLGHDVYDFLAGDARYKRSLGLEQTELETACFQRDLFRFRLERTLKAGARRLRA